MTTFYILIGIAIAALAVITMAACKAVAEAGRFMEARENELEY